MSKAKTFDDFGVGELRPGVTPRRWEPEGGISKLRSKINRDNKKINSKNLPFTFGKPYKPIGRNSAIKCNNCGNIIYGTTATVGIICRNCKKFSTVSEV